MTYGMSALDWEQPRLRLMPISWPMDTVKQHKYERIDKGQKRIPRKPDQPKTPPNPTGRCNVLANVDDEQILARIAAGEHAMTIADELGVHKSAISHRYGDNPQYLDARRAGSEIRLTKAEQDIAAATDPFNLARARELFRAVAWRAEREFPDKWGQKQEVKHSGQVGPLINIVLSDNTKVIDATPNPVSDPE